MSPYAFGMATHPGLVRENNEDALAFDAASGVAVLADGMGGYNAGEMASAMAVTLIRADLAHWLLHEGAACSAAELERAVRQAVQKANFGIYNAANGNPQFAGMGTTVVVAVLHGAQLVLAHVGDSRIYRFRHGALAQLTHDHSLLQEQLDAGLLTPEQARFATHKNLVTRALGVEPDVQVDVQQLPLHEEDILLLCSDGLTDMLDDALIAATLAQPRSLQARADALIAQANEAGGRDNISALLVQAKAKSEFSGLLARMRQRP